MTIVATAATATATAATATVGAMAAMTTMTTATVGAMAGTTAMAGMPTVTMTTVGAMAGMTDGDDDGGDEAADFAANINLPLSAVGPLLSLVPHGAMSDRLLDLTGEEVNVGAMRDLWRAIAGVGEAEFVAVDGDDETVRIARTGDQINVQVEECDEDGGEVVDIRVPVAVVDALLSGDGEALNVHAAVEQLGKLRGDIVRVSGGEHQVRVWIDEVAQPGN